VSLQQIVPWLLALQLSTITGMMLTARAGLTAATGLLAAAFVAGAVAASMRANAPYWRGEDGAGLDSQPFLAARRNTRLAAITYAWAALAMQALYTTSLTGLRWHHGWQYAIAFALLAFGAFLLARALGPQAASASHLHLRRMTAPLAVAQAIVAALGLVYLAGSGKLLLHRADWAANIIFVSAALAIMILSAISLRTHVALMRRTM
jgi:hypothetical protein